METLAGAEARLFESSRLAELVLPLGGDHAAAICTWEGGTGKGRYWRHHG